MIYYLPRHKPGNTVQAPHLSEKPPHWLSLQPGVAKLNITDFTQIKIIWWASSITVSVIMRLSEITMMNSFYLIAG